MEVDKLDILKCFALAATGLFAGGSILINVVINPALRKLIDIEIARRFWKDSFYRAAKWQVCCSIHSKNVSFEQEQNK